MACVEYNKALEQSLFNVCSVCINKAWLGLRWEHSVPGNAYVMWQPISFCSLLLLLELLFAWAERCRKPLHVAPSPELSSFLSLSQCWILGEQQESSRGHLAFAGLENAELGEVACWEDDVLSFQTRCKAVTGALVCEWRLMAARGALFVHCGFIK